MKHFPKMSLQKSDRKITIVSVLILVLFFSYIWYIFSFPPQERFGFRNIPFWFAYLIVCIGFISILSNLLSFFIEKRKAKDFSIAIILFFFSIYYSIGIYNLFGSIQETTNYHNTEGIILENEIRWTGDITIRESNFYLHLRYSYTAPDGLAKIGTYTYLYDTDLDSDRRENFVKQYPVGSQIKVFYNPKIPEISCLYQGFKGGIDWYLYTEIIDLLFILLLVSVSIRFLYLGITDKGSPESTQNFFIKSFKEIIKSPRNNTTDEREQIETLPSKTEYRNDGSFHTFIVRWMSYLILIILSIPIYVSIGYIFFYTGYENLFLYQNRNPTILEIINILFFLSGIAGIVLIWFNKTVIKVNRKSCIIYNSPIRWKRIKEFELTNFKDYFIKENPTFFGNELWAKDFENNDIFMERFDSYDQAIFFKRFIKNITQQ